MTKKEWTFNNTYEKLPSRFYRKVHLNPVENPSLLYYNEDLAKDLGLDEKAKEDIGIFSGSHFPKEASSISQAYMGDQFGSLVMLGDGRAVLVGEVEDVNKNLIDIQLKGSGRTPFSRGGDGRAALGPMLKEYIFSEAMYGLGVKTTRSLALVLTGESVIRNKIEKGAILTRTASSHLRVGTFQYAYYQQNKEDLKTLCDYAINRHYKELEEKQDKYLKFFERVLINQADLIAHWMSLGFVHGVMNTDNMTISGQTIDYGPCAFIDQYDMKAVYSSIDRYGRYAFGNQPNIGFWNLGRFGEALSPIISENKEEALEKINGLLENYPAHFFNSYYNYMTKKLGIFQRQEGDENLVNEFLSYLGKYKLDYTNSFLDLTNKNFKEEVYLNKDLSDFLLKLENRLNKQEKSCQEIKDLMLANNPQIIPRNFWIEEAIKLAENGDFTLYEEFFQALKDPYKPSQEKEKFKKVPENRKYITYCGM